MRRQPKRQLAILAGAALLLVLPPVGRAERQATPSTARQGQTRQAPAERKLPQLAAPAQAAAPRAKQGWSGPPQRLSPSMLRLARMKAALRYVPKRIAGGLRAPRSRIPQPRAPRGAARSKVTPRQTAVRQIRQTRQIKIRGGAIRVVARVKPMSHKVFRSRSRQVLAAIRGPDRRIAARMLGSSQVRRSPEAQHAVLAYLRLRTLRGGQALPLTVTDITKMVTATGSKGWNARRLGNFALVLQQAGAIAKRDKLGAKQAFDKALRLNGIYNKYYRGVCGG
jgi:hypothetical protein